MNGFLRINPRNLLDDGLCPTDIHSHQTTTFSLRHSPGGNSAIYVPSPHEALLSRQIFAQISGKCAHTKIFQPL